MLNWDTKNWDKKPFKDTYIEKMVPPILPAH